MGLTIQSVGKGAAEINIKERIPQKAKVIALAGNPNVGKSTLFNKITGLKQHTGNWPGKTVTNAVGEYKNKENHFAFVDIPGTYSLIAHSAEEEVARDFLVFGEPDLAVVVCDATCLERNLNLVLQVSEVCPKVVVCVNLLDEAYKKGIFVDLELLSQKLGLPVVGTSAQKGKGTDQLIEIISKTIKGEFESLKKAKPHYPEVIENAINSLEMELNKFSSFYNNRWMAIRLLENDTSFINKLEQHFGFCINENYELCKALQKAKKELFEAKIDEYIFKKYLVSGLILTAESICDEKIVKFKNVDHKRFDFKIDKLVTGKITGPICMILLLAIVFWITVSAANYPSSLLWQFFGILEVRLFEISLSIGMPTIIADMLFHGVFRVVFWVV